VNRWRCYVASFKGIEPTEQIDLSKVKPPYLKNRLAKNDDLSSDERLDSVEHRDTISISINPYSYRIRFINSEPLGTGGVQYFVHPDKLEGEEKVRAVLMSRALREIRKERIQERLIRNTNWMKDVSRDDVDARKAAFKKDIEEPRAVGEGDEDDVEMAD
jgi:paired amphipathic helix protein Sin3a